MVENQVRDHYVSGDQGVPTCRRTEQVFKISSGNSPPRWSARKVSTLPYPHARTGDNGSCVEQLTVGIGVTFHLPTLDDGDQIASSEPRFIQRPPPSPAFHHQNPNLVGGLNDVLVFPNPNYLPTHRQQRHVNQRIPFNIMFHFGTQYSRFLLGLTW